jgi:acetyl esterase
MFYPATNAVDTSPSLYEFGEEYSLTMEMMRSFGSAYFSNPRDALSPYISPVFADLRDLPPL